MSINNKSDHTSLTILGDGAVEFINDHIDHKLLRILRGQLRDFTLDHCFILRNLAMQALHPELLDAPCFISHDNLLANNYIVDDDFNIQGFAKPFPQTIDSLSEI